MHHVVRNCLQILRVSAFSFNFTTHFSFSIYILCKQTIQNLHGCLKSEIEQILITFIISILQLCN